MWLPLILVFFSFSVQSREIDGFIVKLKSNQKNQFNKSIQRNDHFFRPRNLNISWGDFYYFKAKNNQALAKSDILVKMPEIEYVVANEVITIENEKEYYFEPVFPSYFSSTSDPLFKNQWGLDNTGKNNWAKGGKGIDTNGIDSWNIEKGNRQIIVAIIDSGIDYNHPDLKKNMYKNEWEKNGLPGVDDDLNGYVDDIYGYDFANNDGDPMDGLGHGTHCAGIVGAVHNSIGVAGVMSHVRLMALKFLKDIGRGDTKNALKAINYAIDNGARVISNSWTGDRHNQAMIETIKRARDRNIIFVASAGNIKANIDKTPKYPASYSVGNVVSVSAINGRGDLASFSSYGPKSVLLAAPGTMIVSTWPTSLGRSYMWKTGTSMAAPFVSGAIGLLLSKSPSLNYAEIVQRLKDSVRPMDDLKGKVLSEGLLDTYKLLSY